MVRVFAKKGDGKGRRVLVGWPDPVCRRQKSKRRIRALYVYVWIAYCVTMPVAFFIGGGLQGYFWVAGW
jgi:hypothetical protein